MCDYSIWIHILRRGLIFFKLLGSNSLYIGHAVGFEGLYVMHCIVYELIHVAYV